MQNPRYPSTAPPAQHADAPVATTTTDRRTVEDLAVERGHLRLRADGTPDPRFADYWKFRAAQIASGWAQGAEVSEADYDAAIRAAESVEVR